MTQVKFSRFGRLMHVLLASTCALALLATPMSVYGGHHKHGKGDMKKKKDIVDTAASKDAFKTLVAAVKAADLAEALKGKGPFTVLAPTNAAFEKLPEGTLESLLKPENKAQLQAILKYHVVPGRYPAAKVTKADKVETLQGASLPIEVKDGDVMIGGATVTATDVKATNGVIHVIDTVLIPPQD